VLRRDRIVVILALTLLTALAWSYLLWLSVDMAMGGMDMGDFRMIPSGMGLMVPAHTPWQPMEFAFVFAMWTVMMVGMMTPSATPMIVVYARVGRQTETQGTPFAAPTRFPFIGTAEAPKVPPSPMPAAATAARKHIRILDIVTLQFEFYVLARCQDITLMFASHGIDADQNTAVCEAHRARRRSDRISEFMSACDPKRTSLG
jgi:hypothetical protein